MTAYREQALPVIPPASDMQAKCWQRANFLKQQGAALIERALPFIIKEIEAAADSGFDKVEIKFEELAIAAGHTLQNKWVRAGFSEQITAVFTKLKYKVEHVYMSTVISW